MAMKATIKKAYPCLSVFIRGLFLVLACTAHAAQVTVTDAWVRGTVPAQSVTGAFATLTSTENAKLVAVKTPVAKTVEIHRSDMRGGTMRMEAVDAVPLPAGKPVKLDEGGFHVMLMGVSHPIRAGTKVPLEFVVEDAKGKRSTVSTQAFRASARAMKLPTRLAQRGRKARSQPGTVNLPVTRASTVTFASLAEMEAVQRRFEADEPAPTYGIVNMPLRTAFEE
jgi:Uncharacterized protein conserved in bacteria